MEKFRVKALYMGGKGNKIHNSGDILTADQLSTEPEKLIKEGFIEAYKEPSESDEDPAEAKKKEFKKLSKAQVTDALVEKNIDYDEKLKKDELFELWLKTFEPAEGAGGEV